MIVKWCYDYTNETVQYNMLRHGKMEKHSLRKGYYKRLIVNSVIHTDSVLDYKNLHRCIKHQLQSDDVDLICKDHHDMYRHYTIRYHYTYLGNRIVKAFGVAIPGALFANVEESIAR